MVITSSPQSGGRAEGRRSPRSAEISLGLGDQQCTYQVDDEDDGVKIDSDIGICARPRTCERDEGRHHAAQRKTDIPG